MTATPVELWQCGCPTDNIHPVTEDYCRRCTFARAGSPYDPSRPDALPIPQGDPLHELNADERARLLGLVEWLDATIAAKQEVATSVVGIGISAFLTGAKQKPEEAYAQLSDVAVFLDGLRRWVADGVPPDVSFLATLLGPIDGADTPA